MPSSTVNICVVALVLLSLQQISEGRPQTRNKRGLVKHYFEPDVLVFSPEEFEKGADGKYYLKNSSRKLDSLVDYAAEDKDNVFPQDVKNGAVEDLSKSPVVTESAKRDKLKEESIEILKADEALVKPSPPAEIEIKITKKDLSKPDITTEEKLKKNEKVPFIPDSKLTAPEKPDSKDEISLKSDLPPVDVDEKADEKISIGQVPHFYPRVIPVPGDIKLPILIPLRKVSYGSVSVIPLPPADVSDRLPFAYEDDIVGEGPHETESEEVSKSITEEKKKEEDKGYNPLMGIPLPFLPFRTFLGDGKESKQEAVEKQSKVVDILGKKFLMQSRVMKQPVGDNSNMYVRFMSVKPMEEVEPSEPIEKEESIIEKAKPDIPKEIELKREAAAKDAEVIKGKKGLKEPEVEILKAEETEIKMKTDDIFPRDAIHKSKGDTGLGENPMDTGTKDAVFVDIKTIKDKGSVKAIEIPIIINKEISKDEWKENSDKILESRVELDSKKDFKNLKGDIGNREEFIEEKEISLKDDDSMIYERAEILNKEESSKKATDLDFKKSIYLSEKNKKLKLAEETEEEKKPKKNEKKKKCKCEEKDSDSDDDE